MTSKLADRQLLKSIQVLMALPGTLYMSSDPFTLVPIPCLVLFRILHHLATSSCLAACHNRFPKWEGRRRIKTGSPVGVPA